MTTTISKKNKHTKPASKKRTGKRIGIRNTKKRSKNSKKSKTSKKNKPKNRLYKGGNRELVSSIESVVKGYNRKVLLKKNESDQSSSDSDSIDEPLNFHDVELDDAINNAKAEINNINKISKVMKDSHLKIAYSKTRPDNLNDEIISEEDRYNIIDDATYVKTLLKNIIKKLPKQDKLVAKSLESDSEFINAVNEYQQHIDNNTQGYIENTNKCDGSIIKLKDFIRCKVNEQKVNEQKVNEDCCVTS